MFEVESEVTELSGDLLPSQRRADTSMLVGDSSPTPRLIKTRPRSKTTCACPTVTLLCNSISASKSKCGFSEFAGYASTPPKKYLTHTFHRTASAFWSPGTTRNLDYSRVTVEDPTTCTTSFSCSGSSSLPGCSKSMNSDCTWPSDSDWGTGPCGAEGCLLGASTITTATTQDISYDCGSGGGVPNIAHDSYVISDEYTTDVLKTTTEDALPAYADCFNCTSHSTDSACTDLITGQGCTCSAFANLSTDETSYTIRRFKYKFRFKGSPTTHLKILWNETFKPTLTAGVTYCGSFHAAGTEDPDPLNWTTTAKTYTKTFGVKCEKPESAPTLPLGATTEFDSDAFTVNEPSTNGTIYLTDIRWSVNTTTPYNPNPSSIEGVDQFAGSSTSYLCNSRTAAQQNCTASTG